jgi:hypothetical protein
VTELEDLVGLTKEGRLYSFTLLRVVCLLDCRKFCCKSLLLEFLRMLRPSIYIFISTRSPLVFFFLVFYRFILFYK